MTETQVGNGNTTGLLRVIVKVCLCIHICIVTDDLDGVLVRTYGTVSTKTPELTVGCSFRSSNRILLDVKRQVGNIIDDTDCKSWLLCIIEYSDDLSRSCILGT